MLYSGLIVDNTYQIIEGIGSGGMGVVYLAYHLRLKKNIVMKKIKNSNADMALLRNEVDVLKELHHPYLPQVYDFIQYENDLYTIIDYIDGYDLKFYIDNQYTFSESQLIKWLLQLCEVLEYLHSNVPQVLHTDIKPANIIIKGNGDVCLIDFGISMSGNDQIKGISADYSSPEQYNNVQAILCGHRESCVVLDERIDIYSLGATFYHIITGIKPSLLNQLPKAVQYNLGYSEPFVRIVDRCMCINRDDRFKRASQIIKAVENIYKMDLRYKRYVGLQVVSSVLAGIMIVSGAIIAIKGYRNQLVSDYEAQYSQLIYFSNSGNTDAAISAGYSLLNDSRFSSLMDDDTQALVLHKMGDCYYDSSDFHNAAYYYKQAIAKADNPEDEQLYYRDYIFSLVNNGKQVEAEAALAEVLAVYPDSGIGGLVDMQICYKNGAYQRATQVAASLIAEFSNDAENLNKIYIVLGDSYNELGMHKQSMEAFSDARNTKETADVLRKLGNSTLKYANNQRDARLYVQALECFETLYNNYSANSDDIFNLAQCYLLCGGTENYKKSEVLLEDYIKTYGADCRLYIMLAIASDATGGLNTQEYCINAKSMYQQLSSEEKMLIDNESLDQIKSLYKSYCGGVW